MTVRSQYGRYKTRKRALEVGVGESNGRVHRVAFKEAKHMLLNEFLEYCSRAV